MTSFGRFETVREIHRSGFNLLYSGRTKTDLEVKFAIKVFQSSTFLLESEQIKTESDLFLNSALVQQKTVAGGAEHWAPIHEFNLTPNGAFYATDQYDRSLQQLIDVRIKLNAQALLEIVESVAKGLIELKQACGRPHGNLKATNILIAGEGDISRTAIVLSDPLPDKYIDTEVHWETDLRAVAELIYQLIMHRPTPAVGGWQITDSKEWGRLGKQANDWINLCNRLLNAHLKPGTMTIETLIDELARFKQIKPVLSTHRLLIFAGFAFIVVAALIYIKWGMSYGKAANIEDWNNLLTEYFGWVQKLRTDLVRLENGREKRWRNNQDLSMIVENIIGETKREKEKASLPYYASIRAGLLEGDLKSKSIEELNDDGAEIYDKSTKKALKAIEVVKCFFDLKSDPNSFRFFNDPNLPMDKQEYGKWNVLVQIQQVSKKFESRGWQGYEKYLLSMVDDLTPDPNIAENVDKVLEFLPSLDEIQSCWIEIENNERIIANSEDLFSSSFSNYIKQEPAMVLDDTTRADVNNISKKLLEELQIRKQLSKELASSIEKNWQKLKENQENIKSTRDPILDEFPSHVQSRLASANPEILGQVLEQMGSLAGELAKFIEDNWQKVDKTTFFNDHGNDHEENLIDKTFTERRDIIDGYVVLDPNPLDEIFELEKFIGEYMELALASNPVIAQDYSERFDELRQDINDTKAKPIIRKYQVAINDLKLELQKLSEKVIAAAEKPEKFIERIGKQKVVSDTALEEINEKWRTLRDNILVNNSLNLNEPNLVLYTKLRGKITDTNDILNKLDKELQRELPSQVNTELKEKDWNKKLKQFYEQERNEVITRIVKDIPLQDDIPDINEPSFKEIKQRQYFIFQQLQVNLSGILAVFNTIEDGLDACYLLDQRLPESNETARSLWAKWQENISQNPQINAALNKLMKRIKDLEEIEKTDDRDTLGKIAIDPNSQTEAVYTAWTRLGELSKPLWPTETEEFEIERRIQENLKRKFEELGNTREEELLAKLTEIALEREIVFKKASIGRFRETIAQNYASDKILGDITSFISAEINYPKKLSELEVIENLTNKLADFVSQEDWQTDKFRKDLFRKESDIYKSYTSISSNTLEATVEDWLKEVGDYKIVEDPRRNFQWEDKIEEIKKLIKNELDRKQGDTSKKNALLTIASNITKPIENALGSKQTSSAEKLVEKLEQEDKRLKETEQKIRPMLKLDAIKKNEDKINVSICNKHWETLLNHEATVRSIIKPEYCKRLELLEGKVQRLVFATTTELSTDFEPVNINRLQSMTEKEPFLGSIFQFVQGTTENLLGFTRINGVINKLPLSQLGELFNKTVEISDWEQIRQAVKNNDAEWLNFFDTINLNKSKNLGWPKYIVSKKDPSLILRFIPAGGDNPEPFYMTTHEITNAQYRVFLEKSGARSRTNRSGWSWFVDQSNKDLIVSQSKDVPPCAIRWDSSQKVFTVVQEDMDNPVTYVTYHGARSYAESIGTLLPRTSQHKYACKAGDNIISPWADTSVLSDYVHLRAGPWQKAAAEYNSKVGTAEEIPPPPIGAVKQKDFIPYETKIDFDIEKFFPDETAYSSAWPVAGVNKPNAWGLYDMIGNVWEWCTSDNGEAQSVICGGSCLAPLEYILLKSDSDYQYSYDGVASDVGFRVIVPAR